MHNQDGDVSVCWHFEHVADPLNVEPIAFRPCSWDEKRAIEKETWRTTGALEVAAAMPAPDSCSSRAVIIESDTPDCVPGVSGWGGIC